MRDTKYKIPDTVFVVGPTASGKSDLAMRLARHFDGEIICADSQTVRKHLDIGTAKPTKEDQLEIPHHLIDIIEPYERFTAAQFKELALNAIAEIHARGRVAIIVGGTGLYIDALYFNYQFTSDFDEKTRAELSNKSVEDLQKMITSRGLVMPKNLQNPRHLIRTLEIGKAHPQNHQPMKDAVIFGINKPREVLKERINARINTMFDIGFVKEVTLIIEQFGKPPQSFDAIGYKIVNNALEVGSTVEEMKEQFAKADAAYAKRQVTWFRRNPHIQWFEDSKEAFEHCSSTFAI